MFRIFRFCGSLLVFLISVNTVNSIENQPKPITITEDNWAEILEGEWMVAFMAPWCPACRSFKETFNTFSKWSRDLDIQVGVIDVTESPGLSGRFLVTALPSIYHVKNGIFRQYMSSRGEKDLISFVDDKKWKDIEPVSKWTAPDTLQMSLVGTFFKIAMRIRSFYNVMTEEYGIPEWGCYLIFALVTITAGLFIGLLLVCICDLVNPVKQVPPPIPADLMKPELDKQGDILDDTELPDGNPVRQRKVNTDRDTDKDGGKDTDNTQDIGSSEQNKETDKKKD